jgi:hypothetical protein
MIGVSGMLSMMLFVANVALAWFVYHELAIWCVSPNKAWQKPKSIFEWTWFLLISWWVKLIFDNTKPMVRQYMLNRYFILTLNLILGVFMVVVSGVGAAAAIGNIFAHALMTWLLPVLYRKRLTVALKQHGEMIHA